MALVAQYYSACNDGNRDAMLGCLSGDIAHDINQGSRQTGKAAFRAFWAHMDRCYRERLDDITIMANDDGTRAAAEFTVHGIYLATDDGRPPAAGQSYVLSAGAFFELAEGVITRVSVYYNLADWLAQVNGDTAQ